MTHFEVINIWVKNIPPCVIKSKSYRPFTCVVAVVSIGSNFNLTDLVAVVQCSSTAEVQPTAFESVVALPFAVDLISSSTTEFEEF